MRRVLERVEGRYDAAFGAAGNPFYHLGALGWFFYWIVVATGIYLYVFFDTGTEQAYLSVERITNEQWFAGGVIRSFHRYASDALVAVVLLHLTREWVLDRMRGPRWFAWVTGVPVLWMIFAAGVSGYWMVWDKLAQYVAIASTELLDVLPLFGEPIARNFLHASTLSGRFFTLMAFIHIAVPLFMLFVMWVHIHRHAHPGVNPPRGLALGSIAGLLVLSVVQPAYSQGPADLGTTPGSVALDWFYLAALPFAEHAGGRAAWMLAVAGTLLLVALPWLPRAARPTVAVVDLDNCNGCARCQADCPYGAVRMAPRTDGSAFAWEAVVDPALCVACGICTGSCPTATPFRRRSAMRAGIEQPDLEIESLRDRCLAAAALAGEDSMMVFGCEHGASLDGIAAADVAVIRLPCVGMLPPPFLDLLLTHRHVGGIVLAGCRDGDCHFRLGIEWTRARIAGTRDPYLRARVPRARILECFAGLDRPRAPAEAIDAMRTRLAASALNGGSPEPANDPVIEEI